MIEFTIVKMMAFHLQFTTDITQFTHIFINTKSQNKSVLKALRI